jgi:hypothetical protein
MCVIHSKVSKLRKPALCSGDSARSSGIGKVRLDLMGLIRESHDLAGWADMPSSLDSDIFDLYQ